MSAKLRQYDNEVWDRFFASVALCDDQLAEQELDSELARRGIDVRSALSRVQQALESRRAQAQLAAARAKRTGVMQTIKDIAAPIGQRLRHSLDEMVGKLSGNQQAAYFSKLSKAQSEDDLQSLYDDLCKLEALEKEEDGEPGSK